MNKNFIFILTLVIPALACAGAISPALDKKLMSFETKMTATVHERALNIRIFLKNNDTEASTAIIAKAQSLGIKLMPIRFMPGLMVGASPSNRAALAELASTEAVRLIDIPATSHEELDVNTASMLLQQGQDGSVPISNWWNAGFNGSKTVIGVLDSGVADHYTDADGQHFFRHEGLKNKTLYVNRGLESGFDKYLNGMRTPHGTGVACIYGSEQPSRQGVSFGSKDFLIAIAGDSEVDDTDWSLTLKNLDWMLLDPSHPKPQVINYSFGNGDVYPSASVKPQDWSDVAQTVDYIVNHYAITWVKSAGNKGWVSASAAPFASTLSIPADSYNAIVVANMSSTVSKTESRLVKTSLRHLHTISKTSSRGPTLDGRRKPDITAPGNDTRTCAPDPDTYAIATNPTFKPYTSSMQYDGESKTRLMGGTSSATPHVGGAAALISDSGIHSPKMIKALLINSADAWTDNDQPGPGDNTICQSDRPRCGHGQMKGSHWDRTYGWGYINMDAAYWQREFVYEKTISPKKPLCYLLHANTGDKITVVWERRFDSTGKPYHFTPLKMELLRSKDKTLMDVDDSQIDNVLQVANYPRNNKTIQNEASVSVIVKLSVAKGIDTIDGSKEEPFAIASTSKLQQQLPCP